TVERHDPRRLNTASNRYEHHGPVASHDALACNAAGESNRRLARAIDTPQSVTPESLGVALQAIEYYRLAVGSGGDEEPIGHDCACHCAAGRDLGDHGTPVEPRVVQQTIAGPRHEHVVAAIGHPWHDLYGVGPRSIGDPNRDSTVTGLGHEPRPRFVDIDAAIARQVVREPSDCTAGVGHQPELQALSHTDGLAEHQGRRPEPADALRQRTLLKVESGLLLAARAIEERDSRLQKIRELEQGDEAAI